MLIERSSQEFIAFSSAIQININEIGQSTWKIAVFIMLKIEKVISLMEKRTREVW